MKHTSAGVTALAAALAFATVAAPSAGRAPFGRIVVFGTSLSDSGNAFALRGGTNTPPDYQLDPFLVPSAPYAAGGHHFSNGATWVEQLARSSGIAGSARPALRQPDSVASNYAVAAARAYEDGLNYNLTQQVETFLDRSGGVAPADNLYVIEMGGNDIRDALVAYATGHPGDAMSILQQANTAIATNIGSLYGAGARTFLVWRAPNVGITPAIRGLGPGGVALGTALTDGFNGGLDQVVALLSQYPGMTIMRLDAYRLLNDIVAAPGAFGLTNVSTPCVTPGTAPFKCQTPDDFLFWDGIHPTVAAHAIIAGEAASVLGR